MAAKHFSLLVENLKVARGLRFGGAARGGLGVRREPIVCGSFFQHGTATG